MRQLVILVCVILAMAGLIVAMDYLQHGQDFKAWCIAAVTLSCIIIAAKS